ncbi:hypothetical protein SHKM778_67070 [Streptomyces sp. KM77-8]|uniref:Uncharacterized protein n=1 Tax=Streptomyces haneummycinicus TaxID=3074435 RepID=A0AAT9HS85_9ACTN
MNSGGPLSPSGCPGAGSASRIPLTPSARNRPSASVSPTGAGSPEPLDPVHRVLPDDREHGVIRRDKSGK